MFFLLFCVFFYYLGLKDEEQLPPDPEKEGEKKKEDEGVEMTNDFEGTMEDVEDQDDKEEEEEEDKEEEEEDDGGRSGEAIRKYCTQTWDFGRCGIETD